MTPELVAAEYNRIALRDGGRSYVCATAHRYPERTADIITLYRRGVPLKEIAAKLNISVSGVTMQVARYGEPRNRNQTCITGQVLTLCTGAGMKTGELRKATGASQRTMASLLWRLVRDGRLTRQGRCRLYRYITPPVTP